MIIGFCGPLGSGKTSAAQHIVQTHNYMRVPFADVLKKMMLTFGLTEEQVYGTEKEIPVDLLCGKTPRWAMQTIGTEWGRNCIGEDVWVNVWAHAVKTYKKAFNKDSVVDDVRFPNEVAKVRQLGGVIVAIVRPGHDHSTAHSSETYKPEADWEVLNNKTPEEFLKRINMIYERITK